MVILQVFSKTLFANLCENSTITSVYLFTSKDKATTPPVKPVSYLTSLLSFHPGTYTLTVKRMSAVSGTKEIIFSGCWMHITNTSGSLFPEWKGNVCIKVMDCRQHNMLQQSRGCLYNISNTVTFFTVTLAKIFEYWKLLHFVLPMT